MVMPVILTEAELTFEIVTVCGADVWPTSSDPKFRAVGESAIDTPNPLRVTLCGLLAALSANCNMPVRVLLVIGVNAIVIAQLLPARTCAPQVLD